MTADNIKFRCSSLGYLMTEPRSKSETLSETTKTNLIDIYVSAVYERHTEISSKYLNKGNDVEESSVTTISRITKVFFRKNEEHLENDFIKGTPDLFTGKSIQQAETIRDAKSSWDAFTFFRAISKPINPMNYWQGMGYCALTGAKKCFIDYCLNNTPYHRVEGELRKESYKHPEGATPEWIELQILINHVYDKKTLDEYIQRRGIGIIDNNSHATFQSFLEIPLKERHFAFEFERNDSEIANIYKHVNECRKWMNDNLFTPEIILASHSKEDDLIIMEKG